jgi:outer membrane receptor protein involved in Fe transport
VTGAIYRYADAVKVAFLGSLLGNHHYQDSNATSNGVSEIAAYHVWDLTLDAKVYKDHVKLLAGINNIFDEDYHSRVRADGIEPAARRNFYVGLGIAY